MLPHVTTRRLAACEVEATAAPSTVFVQAPQTGSRCPLGTTPAQRLHRHSVRSLADRPWAAYRGRWQRRVRKWCGRTPHGRRRSFTERLPTVTAPWARRTQRLAQRLVALGWVLGGQAGVQLSRRWGLTVSRNSLLRLLRRQPLPVYPTPTVLGVDDWSLRKRHTSGTILVDLEQRRPIALLRDREADPLAQWLHAHPGVQSITRERSKAYADGARQGAPAANQVADRFPLLQNRAEVLDQVFNAHSKELEALHDARRHTPVPQPDGSCAAPVPPPLNPPDALIQAQQRRARRLVTSEQVWAWQRRGFSGPSIAKQLGIGKSPVFRFLRTPTFPERQGRSDRGRSRGTRISLPS